MVMKFKAVLFDFDGLMFDTEKVWRDYFYKANEIFNTNFTEEDRIKLTSVNEQEIRVILKKENPTLNVDEYRNWLLESVVSHNLNKCVDAKKGLINLLNYLNKNNYKIAIVSGSSKDIIVNILQKAKINLKYFNIIISGDDKIKAKPSPDVYLHACKTLGLKPSECVVLEDSNNGVRSGFEAGCFTIMIPDTMPATSEMKKKANLILKDLDAVIDFLNNN